MPAPKPAYRQRSLVSKAHIWFPRVPPKQLYFAQPWPTSLDKATLKAAPQVPPKTVVVKATLKAVFDDGFRFR
jgi:hypothetical protein